MYLVPSPSWYASQGVTARAKREKKFKALSLRLSDASSLKIQDYTQQRIEDKSRHLHLTSAPPRKVLKTPQFLKGMMASWIAVHLSVF
jgi:hypothetical protein